eukprot:8259513-Ditylum_brightwellii.AAC.1
MAVYIQAIAEDVHQMLIVFSLRWVRPILPAYLELYTTALGKFHWHPICGSIMGVTSVWSILVCFAWNDVVPR